MLAFTALYKLSTLHYITLRSGAYTVLNKLSWYYCYYYSTNILVRVDVFKFENSKIYMQQ